MDGPDTVAGEPLRHVSRARLWASGGDRLSTQVSGVATRSV